MMISTTSPDVAPGTAVLSPRPFSRRTFLAGTGASVAAAMLPQLAITSSFAATFSDDLPPAHLLCSIAGPASANHEGSSELFGFHSRLSSQTQVSLPSPGYHATHPTLPVVYIANAVEEYDGRPRGAVSAVAVDTLSGALHHLGTEPLALFATRPERIAVSPDGRSLLVTAAHGGSLSLLPLHDDGCPAAVTHTLRFPGCGPNPTQPRSAPFGTVFHPSAPLAYVTDRGTDSLLLLSRTNPRALALEHRHLLPPGFEPADLALGPNADCLWLCSQRSSALLHISLDPRSGFPSGASRLFHLPGRAGGPILINATTGVLFVPNLHRGATLLSRLETGNNLTPTLRSTALIPELGQPAQLALLGPALLLAGDRHLVALNAAKHTPQTPFNLLSRRHLSGISTVPIV